MHISRVNKRFFYKKNRSLVRVCRGMIVSKPRSSRSTFDRQISGVLSIAVYSARVGNMQVGN